MPPGHYTGIACLKTMLMTIVWMAKDLDGPFVRCHPPESVTITDCGKLTETLGTRLFRGTVSGGWDRQPNKSDNTSRPDGSGPQGSREHRWNRKLKDAGFTDPDHRSVMIAELQKMKNDKMVEQALANLIREDPATKKERKRAYDSMLYGDNDERNVGGSTGDPKTPLSAKFNIHGMFET